MPDYSKGKIYKLVNSVDTKIYVGATCGTLRLRKNAHKCKSKSDPDMTVYKHLNIVGWENVDIILIEEIKCNNKMELSRRERYWIDELKPVLNTSLPLQTYQEWYDKNKHVKLAKQKIYYDDNKEIILKRNRVAGKIYRENNKEIIKDRRKIYRENNKEHMLEKEKIYRENNRVRVNENVARYRERKRDNIKCPCGGSYDNGFNCKKVRHFRTAKHKKYMDTLIA